MPRNYKNSNKERTTVEKNTKITVIGAGSFGTALAIHLVKNQHEVFLWGHKEDQIKKIQQNRKNMQYLPGIKLPNKLKVSDSLKLALQNTNLILIATPSITFRDVLKTIKPYKPDAEIGISWATKGLEQNTNKFLHQVVAEEFGNSTKSAMISGPAFAIEVAQGLPTAVTVASKNQKYANYISGIFSANNFRCYTSGDITGVEIAAACKNIIAIAAGISDGLGFGSNARSAIITRGLNEIVMLGQAYGAKTSTFMGLAGLGDLTLTCSDDKSRNRSLGLLLAKDITMDEAINHIGQSVEGANAVRIIYQIAREKNIEMPISFEIYQIIIGNHSPQTAVNNLFKRELKPEL